MRDKESNKSKGNLLTVRMPREEIENARFAAKKMGLSLSAAIRLLLIKFIHGDVKI